MGATDRQRAVLPRAAREEWASLSREQDSELKAAGLYSLAARLENRRPEISTQIYQELAAGPETSARHRELAQARAAALRGEGEGGARFEAWLGRFAQESTDYRMIVPMMAAVTVSGLVRAAAFGRLSANAGSWFSRGLGARAGAGGLAFAAEAPAFALSSRGLRAWAGDNDAAPFSQELAGTALVLGFLKTFSSLGGRLAPRSPALWPLFAAAGLFQAQTLEEHLGWRPASDSATRVVDALAATLSLGVGARLGQGLLGRRFGSYHQELGLRAELALSRPTVPFPFPTVETQQARHRRSAFPRQIQERLAGGEPSPIWSKELLIDKHLRLEAEAVQGSGPVRMPASLFAFGAGLSALFTARSAGAEPGVPWTEGISAWESWGWEWKAGALAAGLTAAYGLARWLRPKRPAPVPPTSKAESPAESSGSFNIAELLWTQERILERYEREGLQEPQFLRFEEMKPAGWVKEERKNILRQLKNPHLQEWERNLALKGLLTRLSESIYFSDVEIMDATKLCWELALHPGSGVEGRSLAVGAYFAFLNSPSYFEHDSAPVYRESIRLRRIYSDPGADLSHRVKAVDAFITLFRKFRLSNEVAWNETRMVKRSLDQFLTEEGMSRGTKEYFVVNTARYQVAERGRAWIASRGRSGPDRERRKQSKD